VLQVWLYQKPPAVEQSSSVKHKFKWSASQTGSAGSPSEIGPVPISRLFLIL